MMDVKRYRLTSTSYAVLALLDLLGEATPYDLKQALVSSIENFWRVPHTTFYEEPARLARAGYLAARQEPTGRRRRLYTLTGEGRDALRAWAREPEAAPEQVRDEGLLKIFAGGDARAILHGRIEYHRAKLAEFEGYLANVRAGRRAPRRDKWRGAEVTLMIGVSYHRDMVAMIERLLREESPVGSGAPPPAAAARKARVNEGPLKPRQGRRRGRAGRPA